MEMSRIRQRIGMLCKARQLLEKDLLAFRLPMVKGSLYRRYLRCGNAKADCRCRRGEKHGPFYYMSVLEKGKMVHQYLGTAADTPLAKRLIRYKTFQERIRRLRQVERDLEALWEAFREGLMEARGSARRASTKRS